MFDERKDSKEEQGLRKISVGRDLVDLVPYIEHSDKSSLTVCEKEVFRVSNFSAYAGFNDLLCC